MKAVILAGGMGTRISEETDRVPKPMIQIGGHPILWHIMKIYSHYGIDHFVICLGYKGYLIKEYFKNFWLHESDVTIDVASGSVEVHRRTEEKWKVTLVETGLNTATGGRLKKIKPLVQDDTFLMTYGDGLSDVNISETIRFHQTKNKLATITAIRPPGRFGILKLENGIVSEMLEKPALGDSIINGGFFVLEPKALEYIPPDLQMPWEQEPLQALSKAGELCAFEHHGFWQPMDTLREKNYLEEIWATGKAPWKVWKD